MIRKHSNSQWPAKCLSWRNVEDIYDIILYFILLFTFRLFWIFTKCAPENAPCRKIVHRNTTLPVSTIVVLWPKMLKKSPDTITYNFFFKKVWMKLRHERLGPVFQVMRCLFFVEYSTPTETKNKTTTTKWKIKCVLSMRKSSHCKECSQVIGVHKGVVTC